MTRKRARQEVFSRSSEEVEEDEPRLCAPHVLSFLKEAFERKYQTVSGLDNVELLRAELQEVGEDWLRGKNRIAPMVTMVQSSGWGKSRTTCELATRGVFVVYCSFASPSGSAYPPRSAIADFFYDSAVTLLSSGPLLVSQSRFMLFCMDYFESCIDTAVETKLEPEAFLKELMLGARVWNIVRDKINGRKHDREKLSRKLEPVLLRLHGKESNVWDEWEDLLLLARRRTKIRNKLKDFPASPSGKLQVLFVMDEARWTRATRVLPDTGAVAAIFIDTCSSIIKSLAPRSPPETGSLSLDHVTDSGRLFAYGRPLWAAMYKACGSRVQVLAVEKLLGGTGTSNKFHHNGTISIEAKLAVLCSRVCIDINPQASIVSRMVASHLLTVESISDDRERVWTDWAVEPAVAAAAALVLRRQPINEPKASGWKICLEELQEGLQKGWIDAGCKAELVARLLLLLAVDRLEKHVFDCFTLEELCGSLCGKTLLCIEDVSQRKSWEKVAKAKFLCLQFKRLDIPPKELTKEQMFALGKAGVGIICPKGGVDMILVGFTGDTFSLETMTLVLLKVSLWGQPLKLDVEFAKCSREFSGIAPELQVPYASLFLNLGDMPGSVSFRRGKAVKEVLLNTRPANASMALALKEVFPQCRGVRLWEKNKGELFKQGNSYEAWKAYFKGCFKLQNVVAIQGLKAFLDAKRVEDLLKFSLRSTKGMRMLEQRSQERCSKRMYCFVGKCKVRKLV
ncbi:uncharacterized protein LOC9662561 [Selaginella moellendorffii]|uniref:uncharacterized protein LOC9662561 n=1 Tax=Selaginella moellendorffii TaxID=88036 RepID=UPI000D1C2F54|nr:uncharacterized protein LOC9662561 [Selaginella moellendorffii]|eukprot:XP_024516310.1 uncharacterized protein LOC9662561 [Selaginella moellendorffii]